jgi:aminopeptidase N
MKPFFTCFPLFCFISSWSSTAPNATQTANSSNYDVIYHRISITVDPGTSAAITNGSVTTYFRTTVNNVSSIEFDLDGQMTVSSATYHGSAAGKVQNTTTDIITLTIPNIALKGTLDSVTVYYSGTPILAPSSGVPSGYNRKTHNSQYAIFTLDEPYTAHNWWPCKESLYDKIDSCVELIVTTPNTYKVAGNGLVTEVPSGANLITTWKTFYPIATYAVNFAVANFKNYQYNITANGKTFPVMNYLFSENYNSTYQTYTDELKKIIPMYVSVLGVDYPFWMEKYGLAECTSGWGALEVPTMTFVASDAYDKYTLAHEAAHQWFGNMVTTNTWHQVWLNEGFAQYFGSVVAAENLYPSDLASKRTALKNSVSTLTYTTYVSDTSTPNNIFIGASTEPYEKGGMILSMLRAWVGDTNFFIALKNYLTAPGIMHGFTAVDSVKKYMQQKTPVDLTTFFNDWVNKKGRVTYSVKYQYVTNGVYIQLIQSPTVAGQGHFDMPVPIRIKNVSGLDTTVVIIDKGSGVLYNNVTGGTYSSSTIYYRLSQTPTSVTFDPNDVVLATASSINSSTSLNTLPLPVKDIDLNAIDKGTRIIVNWSVSTDEAFQSIILEKSNNATDFIALQSTVPTRVATNFYKGTYNDEEKASRQYYRLKIVKLDRSVIYSKLEVVNSSSMRLTVVPNPVHCEVRVTVPQGFSDDDTRLLMYNFSGQKIKEKKVLPDNAKVLLLVKEFTPGIYSLVLINGRKERLQTNFIKE